MGLLCERCCCFLKSGRANYSIFLVPDLPFFGRNWEGKSFPDVWKFRQSIRVTMTWNSSLHFRKREENERAFLSNSN